METIAIGVGMFVFLVLMMVVVLMLAKAKLVASGDVNVVINADPEKTLTTAGGSTLLNTLAAHKIFIPSACGGKGSCGVCKVDVVSGGGAMLPTEYEFERAIRAALSEMLAVDGELEMETRYAACCGDIALLSNAWRLTGTDADGAPVELSGQTSEVARRQPNGRWLLIVDHPWGGGADENG